MLHNKCNLILSNLLRYIDMLSFSDKFSFSYVMKYYYNWWLNVTSSNLAHFQKYLNQKVPDRRFFGASGI